MLETFTYNPSIWKVQFIIKLLTEFHSKLSNAAILIIGLVLLYLQIPDFSQFVVNGVYFTSKVEKSVTGQFGASIAIFITEHRIADHAKLLLTPLF